MKKKAQKRNAKTAAHLLHATFLALLLSPLGANLAKADDRFSFGAIDTKSALTNASNTNEYKWSYSLAQVKAGAAFARGIGGKGVVIGIFDSGVDSTHSEFAGRFLGQYNAYTGTSSATGVDVFGHGTFVAGIAAAGLNGAGSLGIAPEAYLRSFQVINSSGSLTLSDAQLGAAIRLATATHTRIANNSWNSSAPPDSYLTTQKGAVINYLNSAYGQTVAAYRGFINAGGLVVFAAGNESTKNPGFFSLLPAWFSDLQPGWLTAVATDSTGKLASYSNRCGVAAAYCLAAPGTSVISTMRGGGYGIGSGTSFSAPAVSGGAALLMEEFPYLKGSDVAAILLRTANKTGIYADKATYGQGLMDLDKATAPVGNVVVPTSSNVKSAASTVATKTTITASAVLGRSALKSVDIGVLDDYNRSYLVSASNLVTDNTALKNGFSAADALHDFGNNAQTVIKDKDVTARFLYIAAQDHNLVSDDHDRFASSYDSASGYGFGLNVGISAAYQYGAFGEGLANANDYVGGSLIANPYLALAADGQAAYMQVPVAEKTVLRLGSFSGVRNDGDALNNLIKTPGSANPGVSGFVSELRVTPPAANGRLTLRGLSGMVHEQDAVLGTASSGALSLGDATNTLFVGAGADIKLDQQWVVSLDYTTGHSNVAHAADSLVSTGTLTSAAWSTQLVGRDVWKDHDRIGFAVSQPLHVTSGSAQVQSAGTRDFDGNINYTTVNTSLKADAQETDMQSFYSFEPAHASRVSFGGTLRLQPDNDPKAKPELIGLARYAITF